MRNSLTSRAMICALLLGAGAVVAPSAEPEVAIRSCAVRASIDGRVATTTIEQVYVNYTGAQREVVTLFEAPDGAVVGDLAMWVAGLRSRAEVHPRSAAREIYEEIVRGNRDPALLEWFGDGRWQLRVFPVPPNGTQKVELIFREVLPEAKGWLMYTAPVVRRCTAGKAQDFDFSATVRAAGGVADLKAGADPLGVQRLEGGHMTVGFRREQFDLSKTVSFRFRPGRPAGPAVAGKSGDDAYFAAVLPPMKNLFPARPPGRNYALLIDHSASMGGHDLKIARQAARKLLAGLRTEDSFAVVAAAADAALWKDKLVKATKANVAAAVKYIDALVAGGGTDLAAGLRAAESFNTDRARSFYLCVFSDGRDGVGAIPMARKRIAPKPRKARPAPEPKYARVAPNCRLALFGCGPDSWLEALYAADLEAYQAWLETPGDVDRAVADFLARLIEPNTGIVSVEAVGGAGAAELCASDPAPGRRLLVAGRWRGEDSIELKITAKAHGRTVTATHELKVTSAAHRPAEVGRGLRQIWAHLRSRQLYRGLLRKAARPDDLLAIMALSRTHRVPTPVTAFLILESDKMYRDRGIERETSVVFERRALVADAARKAAEAEIDPREKAEAQRLRDQTRELRRLGKYLQAIRLLEAIADAYPWQRPAYVEAGLLREFLAIRQDADDRPEAPPLSGDWHRLLETVGPMDTVPGKARAKLPPAALPPADRKVWRALQAKLPKVEAEGVAFKEVVEYLRDQTGLNIHVRWEAIRAANITKDTPVTMKLRNVTAEKALRVLLKEVGGVNELKFDMDKGVLSISTADEMSRDTVTRVYDARDLIRAPERRRGGFRDPDGGMAGGTGAGGGLFGSDEEEGEAGGGLFGGGAVDPPVAETWGPPRVSSRAPGGVIITDDSPPADAEPTRIYDIRDLIFKVPSFEGPRINLSRIRGPVPGEVLLTAIRETILPETWRMSETPGIYGSVREVNGFLVVTHTGEGHRAVIGLVNKLREGLAGQATADEPPVEAMFDLAGQPTKWLGKLLDAARKRTLSRFSSVVLAPAAGRTFAAVGGMWIDVDLGGGDRIVLIRRRSPAWNAILRTRPGLQEIVGRWLDVVVRAAPGLAFTTDPAGLADPKHPAVVKILEALKKRP